MSRNDGYLPIGRPNLTNSVNIKADSIKTKKLNVTGNATISNLYATGMTGTNITFSNTLKGPTGIFTNVKATSADLTNVKNTSMTGSTLYENNINYYGNLVGPTGNFTWVNSSFVNVGGGSSNMSATGTILNVVRQARNSNDIAVFSSPLNTTNGDSTAIFFGTNAGNANSGKLSYVHYANSSANNAVKLTQNGADASLVVNNYGKRVGILNESPQHEVDVGGNLNVASGKTYKIGGNDVLSANSLGSGVTGSYIQSFGTITSMTGTTIYGNNINYSGTLNGPTGTFTKLSTTDGVVSGTLSVSGNVVVDSNTFCVDSTNNMVGILTATPSKALEVVGDVFLNGTTSLYIGNGTADNSTQKLRLHQSGSTAYIDITGDNKLLMRSGTLPAVAFTFDLSNNKVTSANNFMLEANGTLYSDSVYSSTTSGTADLTISSTPKFIQRVSSSIRYKTDIEDVQDIYSENIYKLRPVWYRSLCKTDRKDYSHFGLLAEEVDLVDKRLVTYNENGQPEGIGWYKIIPLMIKEIQKLRKEIDELKNR